jgi:hypothetical protein
MKLDVKHPLPLYRKLLLENKILFVFGLLLALLGGAVLGVQYWTTTRGAEGIALEHLTQSLDPFIGLLGEAAATADRTRIDDILERAAARDRRIAYLVVRDAEGRPLEVAANTQAASSALEQGASDDETVSADSPPAGRRFIEREFPLVASGRVVGTLTAGIERERFDRFAAVTTAITAAVMLGPVLLLFMVIRVVVRRAVKGLKDWKD